MGDKGLLILKIAGATLTFGATVVMAVVNYKDPNKLVDVLKEAIHAVKQ